jgi:hypothetical protein
MTTAVTNTPDHSPRDNGPFGKKNPGPEEPDVEFSSRPRFLCQNSKKHVEESAKFASVVPCCAETSRKSFLDLL